jgi:serine/threonine-protein kinase
MSDVFVSYKAEDRTRVRPLVAALEADGLTVWWDAQIQGGAAWRQSIQNELERAGCVVVVWSKRSIGPEGEFVHDEASLARKRGVYLPVRIDAVEPPLGFGQTQALALIGWKGERSDPRYQALLAAARGMIGGEARMGFPAAPGRRRIDRRLLLAGGGVLAAGAAGAGGWALWGRMGGGSDDKGIAVLPFANLSGDPAQAYFADGLAEELRGALARLGQLKVIARASCEAVRNAPIADAARKLGVATILTGSVRRSPTLIRVSAQLVDGRSGVERWSETYDRAPGDALEIQSGIAESVASELRIRLGQAEKAALSLGGTRYAAAQDLYLQAVELDKTDDSEAGLRKTLGLLDTALTLDPKYADAHILRARLLIALAGAYATNTTELRAGYAQAAAAASLAVALAPGLARAHAELGFARRSALDVTGAMAAYQRAIALNGGDDAQVLRRYSRFLVELGRADEAVALAARGVALDPLDANSYSSQALVLFHARRYAEAAAAERRVLAMAPKRSQSQVTLGDCLLLLGQIREAQAEYAKAPADDVFRLTGEAIAAARLGDRRGSDKALARLKEVAGDVASYQYGEIHAQRGEIDLAFTALDRAWEVRDGGLLDLRADPFVDPLRGDPRYKMLERRLNFPA